MSLTWRYSGILGPHPNGISGFTENKDRELSNIRIYCDDDKRDVNPKPGSRWMLRPDPPENQRQPGYILNKDRQPAPYNAKYVPGQCESYSPQK